MDEDPAGCQRCTGSQEKRSNQLKYLEQKKKKKKREVQRLQQKLIRTFIDFVKNISAGHGLQNQMVW